ncbi:MAG TPA: 3'-5' exonuclease [Candidatus Eisenbergiella merdipullorum]|uniref:3'-5' exonuclease n=1 Tax=Candidatus Eisenbergiella merdipullorum TaxID=2838553 RepID=A0A9D2IAA9_9FIRM|nr:3'-5' exonuclease [Candidatus Eisenbergiella merdipullorum]
MREYTEGPVRDYVCLDLETTGLHPKTDRIIEIGAVRVRQGRPQETWQTFVNPGRKLTERTMQITGILQEEVDPAPEIGQVLPECLDFLGKDVLVGHSLLFDFSFLKKAAVNAGLSFEANGIDTLQLARKYLPELPSRNLGELCRHFGIPHQAHRALFDAQATAALYELFCEKFYEERSFAPVPLIFHVKKEGPASRSQKERLRRLAVLYGTQLSVDVEKLTRNEASRLADQIIFRYGKVPQTVKNPEKTPQ